MILKHNYLTQSLGYATQSTIQRYLSQASHPIGGVRASPLSRAAAVVTMLRTKTHVLHIFFRFLHKHNLQLLDLTKRDAYFAFHCPLHWHQAVVTLVFMPYKQL
jgi:hypothetical protein